jgi:hypothetical protein
MHAIMLEHGWCTVFSHGVEYAHSVCLIDHAGDFFGCGPLEAGHLVVRRQLAAEDPAAEDESDDSAAHIFVYASQRDWLNGESGPFADFAAYPGVDGLVELEDSAWRFPSEVVSSSDEERPVVVVHYHACDADRVAGALWAHLDHLRLR